MRYIVVINGRTTKETATLRAIVAKKMQKTLSENIAEAVKEFFNKLFSEAAVHFTVTFKKFGQFIINATQPINKTFFWELENLMRTRFHQSVSVHYRRLPA